MYSRSNNLYTNPKPCNHLAEYKLKNGVIGYNLIQESFKTTPYGKTTLKMSKKCSLCSNNNKGRFYMCLICSSVLCFNDVAVHSQCHVDHVILVDIERSELYCTMCSDQVYDSDFDNVVMRKHIMDFPRMESESDLRFCKRRKLSVGFDLDLKNVKRLFFRRDLKSKSCFPLGLRGLNNLGNTCFMNSVLQVLLHAPPLRNYFLSDRHNREICRKMSSDRLCLPCDIDLFFSAVFSGDRTPYSPAQFLYSWWQHSENLATYEQQDAHEFFISMLDRIHDKEGKASLATKDDGDCHCIAHRAFYGLLRSDVTCTSCGLTSTTHDPCMDISLDLGTGISSPKDVANKSSKPNESLAGCLDLFTGPEKLGSDQKLYCENCREKHDALKQMSIKKLPLVLCFHIKRFAHSPTRKMSRKIDRHLRFPFSLDMKPYLSSSIVRQRYGNRIFSFDGDESDISSEYEIFAVVTHSGMLESGHYVTYLRLRNQWYKCDDAWITEVDEEVVRASQCYLMYYVQKMLYHKNCEDVSCHPTSLQADTFVPIAGCC